MSMLTFIWSMRSKCPTPTAKLVLICLADNAVDSGHCWPSIRHIEEKSGLSRDSVIRALKLLEDAGLVRVTKRTRPDGSHASNAYDLVMESPQICGGGIAGSDHPPQSDGATRVVAPSDPMNLPSNLKEKISKGNKVQKDLLGDVLPDEKENLRRITQDAVDAFNASDLVKPNRGLFSIVELVNDVRMAQVKRCLPTAIAICKLRLGTNRVTREFWDAYFADCDRHEFYSGRTKPSNGYKPWNHKAFEILTREKTMDEVFANASGEEE